MSWFKKLLPSRIRTSSDRKKGGVPEGLWHKCPACSAVLYRAELDRNLKVCPKCNHHLPITARERVNCILDAGNRLEIARRVIPVDILKFRDSKKYKDRLVDAQRLTGEKDALVVVKGRLQKMPVVVCAFEYQFIGGSMGAVVGEKFVRAVNHCVKRHIPLVCVSTSGGARMQEGLTSLMQMAKTSAALAVMNKRGIPFISVLTDPTMGGVSASFAMLGDIIIAEPNALIGFAGPRVIAQTVRETLPEGFQRAEFLLAHGAIDLIVDRRHMREKIGGLLFKLSYHFNNSRNLPSVVTTT